MAAISIKQRKEILSAAPSFIASFGIPNTTHVSSFWAMVCACFFHFKAIARSSPIPVVPFPNGVRPCKNPQTEQRDLYGKALMTLDVRRLMQRSTSSTAPRFFSVPCDSCPAQSRTRYNAVVIFCSLTSIAQRVFKRSAKRPGKELRHVLQLRFRASLAAIEQGRLGASVPPVDAPIATILCVLVINAVAASVGFFRRLRFLVAYTTFSSP